MVELALKTLLLSTNIKPIFKALEYYRIILNATKQIQSISDQSTDQFLLLIVDGKIKVWMPVAQ